eukprot:2267905-Amphidinium_carterae.4
MDQTLRTTVKPESELCNLLRHQPLAALGVASLLSQPESQGMNSSCHGASASILSSVVIPRTVPLLLPNPLLEAMEACLDMKTKRMYWQTCQEQSTVHQLWTHSHWLQCGRRLPLRLVLLLRNGSRSCTT